MMAAIFEVCNLWSYRRDHVSSKHNGYGRDGYGREGYGRDSMTERNT
jgi:hypothetical protein